MSTAGCKSYYEFTPCCGGAPVKFCRAEGASLVNGATYSYTGPSLVGADGEVLVSGQCYTVSIIQVYSYYPFSTLYDEIVNNSFLRADVELSCEDSEVCIPCPKKVVVYRCCGGEPIEFAYDPAYPTNNDSNAYIYLGLALVFGSGGVLYPNDCFRIEVVNTTQEIADSLPPGPPILQVSLAGKSCGNYQSGIECRDTCNYFYRLVNCADETETYCTATNLYAYINNLIEDDTLWPVIQVSQYPDKCFYVELIDYCTAPVPVTVTDTFIGCVECQETIVQYYRLEDCNNPTVVVYTSTDLSAFVGEIITVEEYQGQCFYVTVYDGLVPVDTSVTPKDSFATCEDCLLPVYVLEDCLGQEENIYTQTDLSAYVDHVITLTSCPNVCWIVSQIDIVTSTYDVYVDADFIDCPECLVQVVTPQCVSFTNSSGNQQDISVIGIDGEFDTIDIAENSTTPKACYISWTLIEDITATVYGNCIDGQCPPLPPKPKRKVTPGYDTPTCTPEYYEKVECNFSEWMYKDVLEKRYGIANCCPEDLIRWEIKHEMLMLDALVNPDYSCTPASNCGCTQPSTCNCSCNSGN